uniref:Uncharacterized protein n=2 Tax=Rhodnius prolixus TaxID=13249 RepID=T1HYE0_RHOPR
MSTNAKGKNVKTSSSMEAKSGKNKGSTKGKASTQVKGKKKKREDSGEVSVDDNIYIDP